MLTTSTYAPILIVEIVFEDCAIMHLEKFNLFSSDNLKRAGNAG